MRDDKIEASTNNKEAAAWNINSRHAAMIALRLEKSQRYCDEKNYDDYLQQLVSIFELVTHNLKTDTKTKMDLLYSTIMKNKKYFQKCTRKANIEVDLEITDKERELSWKYINDIKIFNRNVLKILLKTGYLTSKTDESNIRL